MQHSTWRFGDASSENFNSYYSMLRYGRCDGLWIAKWLMWLAMISDWLAGKLDGWRFVSGTLTVFYVEGVNGRMPSKGPIALGKSVHGKNSSEDLVSILIRHSCFVVQRFSACSPRCSCGGLVELSGAVSLAMQPRSRKVDESRADVCVPPYYNSKLSSKILYFSPTSITTTDLESESPRMPSTSYPLRVPV